MFSKKSSETVVTESEYLALCKRLNQAMAEVYADRAHEIPGVTTRKSFADSIVAYEIGNKVMYTFTEACLFYSNVGDKFSLSGLSSNRSINLATSSASVSVCIRPQHGEFWETDDSLVRDQRMLAHDPQLLRCEQAYHFLSSIDATARVSDLYDNDVEFQGALIDAFSNFEYPDFSHLTVKEVLARIDMNRCRNLRIKFGELTVEAATRTAHALVDAVKAHREIKVEMLEKELSTTPLPFMTAVAGHVLIHDGHSGAPLADDWSGICTSGSDTNQFWYIGRCDGERSFTVLGAKTHAAAKEEAELHIASEVEESGIFPPIGSKFTPQTLGA